MAWDLREHVGASVEDFDFCTRCEEEATELVTKYCGDAFDDVPESVISRAVLECGSELYHRRSAPNGIAGQYAAFDGGAPMRVARDPMVAARPLLNPYLPLGFA